MFLPPFEGPRLLIERSKQHATTLANYVEDVRQRLTIEFVEVARSEHGLIHYRMRFSETPGVEFYLVFRDAINNLAVCLDVTLCDLARLAEKPIEKVKFPFAKTEKGFNGILKDIGLGPVFEEWIRKVHPSYGQNQWLAELHDLDVLMKHRVVVPVLSAAVGTPLASVPEQLRELTLQQIGIDLTQLRARYYHGSSIHSREGEDPVAFANIQSIELHLPDGVPGAGLHVVTILESLADGVSSFVDEVEKLSERMKP